MEIRKTYPHHFLSLDAGGKSKGSDQDELQRMDWGYTNQYRRMMQRRKEQNKELSAGE